jgi:hypothetical protein
MADVGDFSSLAQNSSATRKSNFRRPSVGHFNFNVAYLSWTDVND